MEQELKNAKSSYEQHRVNLDSFKKRVTDSIQNNSPHRRVALRRKSVFTSIVLLLLLVVPFGAYAALNWENGDIEIGQGFVNIKRVGQLEDSYYELLKDKLPQSDPSYKTVTLEEARRLASFPIIQPTNIEHWSKTKEVGLLFNGEVKYIDFYSSDNDQNIVVEQSFDEFWSTANKDPDPFILNELTGEKERKYKEVTLPNTTILDGWGNDLALLTDLKNKRYLINIVNKQDDQSIRYQIWGKNITASELIAFAKVFLQNK